MTSVTTKSVAKKEFWKDIPGYESEYQVSNKGNVKSLARYVKCGYKGKGTPGIPVYQLVMKAFMGPTPEGLEILHIDGDSANNHLNNLRFGTRTENILDVYKNGDRWRKLSVNEVKSIKNLLSKREPGKALAVRFNVSETTIPNNKLGKTFHWLEEV